MSRRTIRVFEHESLAVGAARRDTGGHEWRLRECDLEALVRFNDRAPERVFEVGYRCVKFRQFVGYVQIGDLGIEILPKADRGAAGLGGDRDKARWHDALLEMLRVARRVEIRARTEAELDLHRATLLDVFVARFLDEVERLLHEGLAKSYRTVEENCTAYKGRLLVRQNIRENVVHAERFYVAHTVFDHDHLVNQILRTALDVLARTSLAAGLRQRVDAVMAFFPEARVRELRREDFARLVYGRRTERYREAVELAKLIILHRSPRLSSGAAELLALLFDMNLLWEQYVGAIARRVVPKGSSVRLQGGRLFWEAYSQRRSLYPDIVVSREGVPVLIVDTKWKVPRDGRPSDADLKQMFAYNELYRVPRSILLYPAEQGSRAGVVGMFRSGLHSCETAYLHLPASGARGIDSSRVEEEVDRLLFGSVGTRAL